MNTLIVEDDFTSRLLLQGLLKGYGPSYFAENGKEAVDAVRIALEEDEPFNLICMDIMMPEMDGQEALRRIRDIEKTYRVAPALRVKVIMTTALADRDNVIRAAQSECDYFLVKPVEKNKLVKVLRTLKLIP